MGRFKRGDTVTVNGETAVLDSWPANDEGPFRYKVIDRRTKVEVQKMSWASRSEVMPSGETVGRTDITDSAALTKADVKLVKAGPESEKRKGREVPVDILEEMAADKAREEAEAAKDLVIENLQAELAALRAGAATAGVLLGVGAVREYAQRVAAEPPMVAATELPAESTLEEQVIRLALEGLDGQEGSEPDANELLMAEPRDDLPPAMPRGWGRAPGT